VSRVVVKLGGHALDDLGPESAVLGALARDVADLRARGVHVALVHGGGPQIAALLDEAGVASTFHEGLRVTDERAMPYVAMALGLVNLHVVAALNHAGVSAVGLTGADDSSVLAEAIGGDWGRVGTAPTVGTTLIERLWEVGVTPVLSPVALDAAGRLVNVNADTTAGALAAAVGADSLVLLSDVDQLRRDADDPDSAIESLTRDDAESLLAEGAAREGMRPKLRAALDAVAAGAVRVILANGSRPHALRDVLAGDAPTTQVFA